MQSFPGKPSLLFATLTLVTCFAGATGCSPKAAENTGLTSSKLRAPRAMLRSTASAETKRVLGIAHWRIYRGKTRYILTGYDASGRAVKGVALGFVGKTAAANVHLRGRVLDGTHFTTSHAYGAASGAIKAPSKVSQAFIARALADMGVLHKGLRSSTFKGTTLAGSVCGGDMVGVVTNAMQCMLAANATGVSVSSSGKVARCAAAAKAALAAASSCEDAGGAGASSGGGGATPSTGAGKPSGGGKSAGSAPSGGSAGKGSSSGGKGSAGAKDSKEESDKDSKEESDKDSKEESDKDPSQDPEIDIDSMGPEDPTDGQCDGCVDEDLDPSDLSDQDGANDAQEASQDQSCTSCDGTGADDVAANEQNGDVSPSDDSGGGDDGSGGGGDEGSGGGDSE